MGSRRFRWRSRGAVKVRMTGIGVVAALTGALLAALVGTAGAGSPAQTVALGSATGNPTATECLATVRCTYIPYDGIQFLLAPFDGTITSFSVNSGAAGGQVELRVLNSSVPPRFLNDQWTGAGTGPSETLKAGINTFPVSVAVTKGETIALDNDSGAPIFDTTSPAAQYASVAMFRPALSDGVTAYANAAKNAQALLMSVTEVSGTPTTSTTTTTTTTTTPSPTAGPVISHAFESSSSWHEPVRRADVTHGTAPVGTTFTFTLDQVATVTLQLTHMVPGHRAAGACVARSTRNRRAAACVRAVAEGALVWTGHPGRNTIPFAGTVPGARRITRGAHVAVITARNPAGQTSSPVGLGFTILSR